MEKQERLEKIKINFKKIREGRNWCDKNYPYLLYGSGGQPSDEIFIFWTDRLCPAMQCVYDDLEGLGVSREFSINLWLFGGVFTRELWEQFRDDKVV